MDGWKFMLIIFVGFALVFFLMALWETRNLKDAFDEWIYTMKDWRNAAVPGLIFLLVLALVLLMIGESKSPIY